MRFTPRNLRFGFTVVELLVVIAIIAILVSILIPAVTAVRQQVLSARCLANLHQIGAAINSYAVDHENCLVPGDYWGQEDGFPTPGGGDWACILTDTGYIPAPLASRVSVSSKQSYFRADTDRDDILQCPSGINDDAADYNVPPSSQTDGVGAMFVSRPSEVSGTSVLTWYACNMGINQEYYHEVLGLPMMPFKFLPEATINMQTGAFSEDWIPYKVTKFQDTSHLPLIFDGCWCLWGFPQAQNPTNINARHGNHTQTNLLFADYHCETQITSSLPNQNWYVKF